MEVLGLKRALRFLKDEVTISEVVTDASTTVSSCPVRTLCVHVQSSTLHIGLAATEFPEYHHSLDVWHKSKKLKKSLAEEVLGLLKARFVIVQFPNRLPKVREWEYWTCGQTKSSITSGGHARLVMAKLTLKVTQTSVNNCTSSNVQLSTLQTKWIHHVCGEHQWNTGGCPPNNHISKTPRPLSRVYKRLC